MERIESFKVDHRYITPGVYLSRKDGPVKTLDLRFKKPNGGEYLSNLEMHSLEHLFATYVRNFAPENVLYFGPMGCRTGFYLLVQGLTDGEIRDLIKKTLEKIVYEADEMFGNDEIQCGNYRELSLEAGKSCARAYLAQLNFEKMDFRYPEKEEER
jgi:S-ribosylhomocysteine lyase